MAQFGLALRYIAAATRQQGLGVIFVTHNRRHAFLVGGHFMALARGEVDIDVPRAELPLEKLMFHKTGGSGLATLQHELHGAPPPAD